MEEPPVERSILSDPSQRDQPNWGQHRVSPTPKTHPAGLDHITQLCVPLVRPRICSKTRFSAVYKDSCGVKSQAYPADLSFRGRHRLALVGSEWRQPSSRGERLRARHGDVSMEQSPALHQLLSLNPSTIGQREEELSGRRMSPARRSKGAKCPVPPLLQTSELLRKVQRARNH